MWCASRQPTMPPTQWSRHDPQGADEDPEDDRGHRQLLHYLLDAVLPAGDLVLVPAQHDQAHARVCPPHTVCLWQPQHVLRPRHLRLLHAVFPGGLGRRGGVLHRPSEGQRLPSLRGSSLGPDCRSCCGDGVGPELQPAQREPWLDTDDPVYCYNAASVEYFR